MEFSSFEIKNFRGIGHIKLQLDGNPRGNVFTLVGLNESGKTTVLEAINYLSFKTETLDPLELEGYSIADPHSLIPISKRSNFNEAVDVRVTVKLDPSDWQKIKSQLQKTLQIRLTRKFMELDITQRVKFKNSKHDAEISKQLWGVDFYGVDQNGTSRKLTQEEWHKAIAVIRPMLPGILYFPNFLFEFPDRIYLEDIGQEKEKHDFYCLVLQDILDALNNSLNLKTHILDRAKSSESSDKKALDGLLLEMGRNVTTTVFQAWNRIFGREMASKKIVIKCDTDEANRTYLQFQLEDLDGFYLINERSLGFRWFFVFLLLTQYRGFRKSASKNVLFLFDEPASNLHPSAQNQLLESFKKMSGNCRIIYTTHSHHLINPEWLENTFVVKNEGLNLLTDAESYTARKTNITLTRYREFAVHHPDQANYYRPILDVLDYSPSKLENIPDVVMIEGKNDYYSLQFMQNIILKSSTKVNFVPGMSSGSLDNLIRLYCAWGRQFIVLLDSDPEGKKQKARYEQLFESVVKGRIFTIDEIDSVWAGAEMESLFSTADKLAIQKEAYPTEAEYHKGHFNRAMQELLIRSKPVSISEGTKDKFTRILAFLSSKLAGFGNKKL